MAIPPVKPGCLSKLWRGLRAPGLAALLVLPAGAAGCDGPQYRQFDFWLGQWQVLRPDGRLAGYNHIQPIENGCVLHERYHTPTGYSGQSFTLFDAARSRWHQTWVDNQGGLLLLEGGLTEGKMVLEGESADGQQYHRISWSAGPDGRVRQHWQARSTGAKAPDWHTLFDGYYQRLPATPAPTPTPTSTPKVP
ncbi:hypothetical protein L1F30_13545 [Simiduia sp. 21SJ11W-1]|uniref:hypothetical protein n=1 Tax=Simiduia sp. 21SJ11W-1 TaxID=2909669 RepID=UPI00209D16E3|nr:hypothetical protein [Simiduia sp. 21SJ11W-1]UTA47180.1 hypothetical protein L1F30_13545 [Simiduia sp. 21SJ11W-1]